MTDALQIGCQTYTWEMLGAGWRGTPDHLLDAIAAAGYVGLEITDRMIGRYKDRAAAFGTAIEARGLRLVAYACASDTGFTEPSGFDRDLDTVAAAVAFLAHFPGAHLSLGSATVMSDGPRAAKFDVAARFYNAAAACGQGGGVPVAVHPSSHHDTLLYTRTDYDDLFARLEPTVGWVPDTGHMLRGGLDMLETLRTYRDRLRYLHLKDVAHDGDWRTLGTGVCDIPAVVDAVRSAPGFNGWLVVEEESDEAGHDPVAAVARNRATMRDLGF